MKVVSDLMINVPLITASTHITKARRILRDDEFREIYVTDEHRHLIGCLDITDALRVTDTKSNVTVEGFIREAPAVRPADDIRDAARLIRDCRTDSAAVVDGDGSVIGAILLSDIFPIFINRHKLQGLVADHMSADVVTCRPDDTILKIYRLIVNSGFTAFPVVKKDHLIGIISRRDVIKTGKLRSSIKNAADTKVERIMTTPVLTVSPEDLLTTAAEMLVKHDIGRLPVLQENRLVGVIDRHDMLTALNFTG